MKSSLWRDRNFRLLLYLEWILLIIAVIPAFTVHPPPPQLLRQPPPPQPPQHFPIEVLSCIVTLGLLGLRLPVGKISQLAYTTLGFGLCWLVVFFGGQKASLFSALLLIVVIRACVLFPWRERVVIAIIAYISFLLRLLMRPNLLRAFNSVSNTNADLQQMSQNIQQVIFNLAINSALLFALVLIFVVMLVGAVLAERESRTALTQANQRLRQYALLVENQAIVEERTRIAREMHDSVGHALTAQSIQLENVSLFLKQENGKKTRYHLEAARHLGRDALLSVRQSVSALRSHPLQGRSLSIALEYLIEQFQNNTNISVHTEINISKLPSEVEMALYRVIQEALTNITKYSQATQIKLTLQTTKKQLNLTIKDNGKGFNPTENTTGFGIQGMRERVEAIGGNFFLSSQPGQGCFIQISLKMGDG